MIMSGMLLFTFVLALQNIAWKPWMCSTWRPESGAPLALSAHLKRVQARSILHLTHHIALIPIPGHAAVVLSDDRIMIFGGSSKMNVCAKQFHILHTKSGTYAYLLDETAEPQRNVLCQSLGDGRQSDLMLCCRILALGSFTAL